MPIVLTVILSLVGVGLGMLAGAGQGWQAEQGLDVGDMAFLLIWDVPWRLTLKALWRIPVTCWLLAIAGGVAAFVWVIAGLAGRVAHGLIAATPIPDDVPMIDFLKEKL
jgi:hypothetical protein